MITLQLSGYGNTYVYTFDGNILEELQPAGNGRRWHISVVGIPELLTDKHGKHEVLLMGSYYSVDDNTLPAVTNLIAEIQRAKAAFHFD